MARNQTIDANEQRIDFVGLRVVPGALSPLHRPRWPDSGEQAFRVSHCGLDGVERVFPIPFVRECDAQAAMRALESFTDWSKPYSELVDALDLEAIRRRMIEALPW